MRAAARIRVITKQPAATTAAVSHVAALGQNIRPAAEALRRADMGVLRAQIAGIADRVQAHDVRLIPCAAQPADIIGDRDSGAQVVAQPDHANVPWTSTDRDPVGHDAGRLPPVDAVGRDTEAVRRHKTEVAMPTLTAGI